MYRRLFAMILALVMVFTMLPGAAMATDEAPATEPVVTEPVVTEPQTTEPKTTEPKTTEPKTTEPKTTEPKTTEPKVTEPKVTEPVATEPKATEPKATEPAATEPKATEPQATEPAATEPQATQPAATEPTPDKKVKFTSPGKRNVEKTLITVHLDFEFPEGSGLSAKDIYDVNVYLDRATEEDWESYDNKYVSAENGWTATFELEEGGTYSVSFGDASIDGYVCRKEGNTIIRMETGETVTENYKFKYIKDEATVTINLDFAEDSVLSSSEIGDIAVTVYSWEWDESVRTLLTDENGRTATVTVPSGWYTLSFSGHQMEDYICVIDDGTDPDATEPGWGISAGYTDVRNCTIRYMKNEVKYTVSLDVAEDSELSDEQIGDITVELENYYTGDSYSAILSSANNRTATLTLTPGYYAFSLSGYEKNGYVCDIENSWEAYLEAGDVVRHEQTITYTRNEATIKVSLTFEEDSVLEDDDVGAIKVVARDTWSDNMYEAELVSDGNGTRTATLTVVPGRYYLSLEGWKLSGYVCRIDSSDDISLKLGDVLEVDKTISYVKGESLLSISLRVAEDSLISDEELGDIKVKVDGKTYTLGKENGRKIELVLEEGIYSVDVDLPVREGLYHKNIDQTYHVRAGMVTTYNQTIRYIKNEGNVTVSCEAFSGFQNYYPYGKIEFRDYDFTKLKATFTNNDAQTGIVVTETMDSDGKVNVALQPGKYTITLSGYELEAYTCSEVLPQSLTVTPGDGNTAKFSLFYEKRKIPVTIALSLAEGSELTEDVLEGIAVTVRDSWYESSSSLVETKYLNSDGEAEFQLLPDSYYIEFSDYEVYDYFCFIEGEESFEVPLADSVRQEYTAKYVKEEATLTVSLAFDEDSALDGDDIESITAQIISNPWSRYEEEELMGTVLLTKENGWKGQLTVPAEAMYYDEESDDIEGGFSYYLEFVGEEQPGHRALFAGANYTLEPVPGETTGWNVIAKYFEGKNKATVTVRLSEDSDMPAAELRDSFSVSLNEIAEDLLYEGTSHSGVTVFTRTFDNLPDSDCYRLEAWYSPREEDIDAVYDVTIKSITCTGGDVLYTDLEEGQLDFSLTDNCEIEIVLLGKDTEGDQLTVITRFTEDSLLKAADFPEGITLITKYKPYGPGPGTYDVRAGENVFSQAENWTKTINLPGLWTTFALKDHPDGYVGTVSISGLEDDKYYINPSDCPTTVYVDICFTEYEPYYYDVEFIFDEDSALKGADAGSFFLDINDSGKVSSYEFKEGSWHQTIEIHGTQNALQMESSAAMLRGFARAGYTYSVERVRTNAVEDEYGDYEYDWERGGTLSVVYEVCYTPAPGKLVVEIDSSLYGSACGTTITVTDADGNIVAQSEEDVYEFITELPAGTYTVSQTVAEDTDERRYFADGPKTITFDPAKGAVVTLLNEYRNIANLELRKVFDRNSELGLDDFRDGITVTVTDATGVFSGTYVLKEENNWRVSLRVPDGVYTVTETDADREGYTRTTQFAFTQTFSYGSESLRGWDLRNNNVPESSTNTATDTVGGPYYIFQEGYDQHKIVIQNSYKSTDIDVPASTGSIIINAGDGFYDFDSGDELTEKPDTGNEVEGYTYIITVDGEEQTVTLKPGETFELDGLEEGTEYTVTPALPDGYPWNTDVTPITGTIGGGDEDDWNVEVSFENDYYYTYVDGILTVVKTDALTDETLKGAKFGLYNDKDCTEQVATATTNKDGICRFTLTEEGTYYLKELKAPEDYYEKSEEVKTVTVTVEWKLETREGTKVLVQKLTASVAGLPQKDGGYVWENERKVTDISVTKKFAHDEDLERPDSVTIVLYQDGEAYETVKLSEANDWTYVWEDMPLGFEYAVDELNVAKGYYKQIRSSGYDFTVVNSGSWIPQTGDESQMMFWCAGAMLSLCAIVFLTEKKRRQST